MDWERNDKVEKINGFWTDENNNVWNIKKYTKNEAERHSKTLIDCRYCRNCSDCCGCWHCRDCRDCRGCWDCHDCRDCQDLYNCYGYIENPRRYVTERIGLRNDNTYFYYGKTKKDMSLQVVCGCFRGNLEEFEKDVLKKYVNNKEYREQYLKEIEKVKVLFELEDKA